MDDLIYRQDAIDAVIKRDANCGIDSAEVLKLLPSAQPDSGYIEQIKWERDLAIRQLADLGYGLGEKPRTNGDTISRQAAIDVLNDGAKLLRRVLDETYVVGDDRAKYEWGIDLIESYIYDMDELPSAEQNKGKWVPGREIGKEILTDGTIAVAYEDYKCSCCGLILYRLLHNIDGTPFYKFCPNCGADMRERKEE